jgi:tetratricopeptide (TPR) repeat protein
MRNVWSRGVIAAAALALALVGMCLGIRSRILSLEKSIEGPAGEARQPPSIGGAEKKENDAGSLAAGEAPPAGDPAPVSGVGESAAAPPAEEIDRLLGVLLDPTRSTSRRQEAWREAARLGLLDEVVAAFEQRAEESPRDARTHADLGSAYLQKLNTVSEMEKGSWATRADRAFDAALAIDPGHWEARFTKALALSYWPAITGKQPESVRQFETLIAQQESAPARPEHAKSYLFLGNLYLGQGKGEKAREVWQRGASLFPGDRELSARLEGAEPAKGE